MESLTYCERQAQANKDRVSLAMEKTHQLIGANDLSELYGQLHNDSVHAPKFLRAIAKHDRAIDNRLLPDVLQAVEKGLPSAIALKIVSAHGYVARQSAQVSQDFCIGLLESLLQIERLIKQTPYEASMIEIRRLVEEAVNGSKKYLSNCSIIASKHGEQLDDIQHQILGMSSEKYGETVSDWTQHCKDLLAKIRLEESTAAEQPRQSLCASKLASMIEAAREIHGHDLLESPDGVVTHPSDPAPEQPAKPVPPSEPPTKRPSLSRFKSAPTRRCAPLINPQAQNLKGLPCMSQCSAQSEPQSMISAPDKKSSNPRSKYTMQRVMALESLPKPEELQHFSSEDSDTTESPFSSEATDTSDDSFAEMSPAFFTSEILPAVSKEAMNSGFQNIAQRVMAMESLPNLEEFQPFSSEATDTNESSLA